MVVKISGRCSSARISARRACARRMASQTGRKRAGAGVFASGSGARGRSRSSLPSSSSKRRSVQLLGRGLKLLRRHARPAGRVGEAAGAESCEVALEQELEPFLLGRRDGAEPVGGHCVDVGAPTFPRSGRRDPQHVVEGVDAVPHGRRLDIRLQLGAGKRALGKRLLRRRGGLPHVCLRRAALVIAQPCGTTARPRPGRHERIVAGRDEVNRDPHHRPLNRAPLLQRLRQVGHVEFLEPCPEPDVAAGRVLGLKATDCFDRLDHRLRRAFEEELAGQQRPVQLACAQRPHGYTAPLR